MAEEPCGKPSTNSDAICEICDVYENTMFTDRTINASDEKCREMCMNDKRCKSAYHNNNDAKPSCFLTNKQTFDILVYDPTFSVLFHRNSSQYCNQDRVSCIMSGKNSEACTIKMNSCLINGPGEIQT